MKKSLINPLPTFFDRYINLVEQDDLFIALEESLKVINKLNVELLTTIGNKSYHKDKWTTKEVLQHIIDTERIQAYRALSFARSDRTELPGFNEKLYGKNSSANKRTIDDLIHELKTLRKSTIQLFQSFNQLAFNCSGICFNQKISVSALGFVIVGHQIHHISVLNRKYLPMAH